MWPVPVQTALLPPPPPLNRESFRTAVVVARREKEERQEAAAVSALDTIAEAAGPGPLRLMKGAYDTGARVRIVTRHARGVRGTATGARCRGRTLTT